MRAVQEGVGVVFPPRRPAQMARVDAAFVTLAAGVGRLVIRRRRRTVNRLAHHAMGQHDLSVLPRCAIAGAGLAVGPDQALVSPVPHMLGYPARAIALRGRPAGQGVAVAGSSGGVAVAHAPGRHWSIAAAHGAARGVAQPVVVLAAPAFAHDLRRAAVDRADLHCATVGTAFPKGQSSRPAKSASPARCCARRRRSATCPTAPARWQARP